MEKNHNLVIVNGVSGVGKDFIINRALENVDSTRVNYIHFGNMVLQLAQQEMPEGFVNESGGMKNVSRDKIEEYKMLSTQCLLNKYLLDTDGTYLLNYHLTYRQDGKFVSDQSTVETLSPRDLIMIISDPLEILERRRSVLGSRRREIEAVDKIQYQQEFEQSITENVAKIIGANALFLYNLTNDPVNLNKNTTLLTERLLLKK